jgi:hypothetical protein
VAGCEKKRFPSLDAAREALIDAKIRRALHHNKRRREQRTYFCKKCCGWHLTSRIAPAQEPTR